MLPESQPVPISNESLPQLRAVAPAPAYDRGSLRPSIVHIGVGGFHRAHLATYVDELCSAGHSDWAIVGVGVLEGDASMANALLVQDGLYSLITRGPDATDVSIIGSIIDFIHAVPDASLLIDRIARPETQLVSLTITEGGYPIDDQTGAFVAGSSNAGPDTTFGLIAAGLEARRTGNGLPLTIMSCDNIMSNGNVARAATLGEAARISDELVAWVEKSVSFPNSMVDRITPATTESDREWLVVTYGIHDLWPVVAEPFRQWVIEDNFAGERPPLEELDVILTDEVEPYEFMKLRLLNAGHSCLAYLAAIDGIDTVDAAMADPHIRRFVAGFLHHEAKPVLPAVAGIDVDEYIESLLERFSNPAIGDQIARLCLDGTAKFPKFLLPTVRAQLAGDGSVALSALALAGWCEYLNGHTLNGEPIVLAADPHLDIAVDFAKRSHDEPATFLELDVVFGSDLRASDRFSTAFARAVSLVRSEGIRSAIDATLHEVEGSNDRPNL